MWKSNEPFNCFHIHRTISRAILLILNLISSFNVCFTYYTFKTIKPWLPVRDCFQPPFLLPILARIFCKRPIQGLPEWPLTDQTHRNSFWSNLGKRNMQSVLLDPLNSKSTSNHSYQWIHFVFILDWDPHPKRERSLTQFFTISSLRHRDLAHYPVTHS